MQELSEVYAETVGGSIMAWIKSFQELGSHPKTKKLARLLGVSLPTAIGHLHLLWWWALSYAKDGDLSRYDIEDISEAMQWDEDIFRLIDSLVVAGFLDKDDSGNLYIHDWDDYGGKLEEQREKDRQRKAEARKSEGSPKDVQRKSDVDKIRKDKIRKDKNNIYDHSEELFERFWSSYPRKVNKKEALKAWNSLKPSEDLTEEIIAGVTYWKGSKQWSKDNGQFIPHASTFLRGERWKERDTVTDTFNADGEENDYEAFLKSYKPKLRSVAG